MKKVNSAWAEMWIANAYYDDFLVRDNYIFGILGDWIMDLGMYMIKNLLRLRFSYGRI